MRRAFVQQHDRAGRKPAFDPRHHHRIGARERLNVFLDHEGRYEIGQEVVPVDALKFKDSRKYPERIKEAMENTGETDALVVMGGAVHSVSTLM